MEALRAGAGGPLRQRMITILAGLVSRTQQNYIGAVRRLAAHYRRFPDRLNEEEVRAYLLALWESGIGFELWRKLGDEVVRPRCVMSA